MKILQILSVVCLQIFLSSSTSDKNASIVIIGAGPAGIAAATRLLEHGFNNILVLEAENRIGGRVNSVYFGEAFIDLGAEWCHGENIVYDLVKNYSILGHTETPKAIYHSSVKNLDTKFCEDLVDLMETIYVPDGQRDFDEGKTVGHYCIEKFNNTIHEKYLEEKDKLEIAKSSLDLFHHFVLSSEGSFSWFEPSAKNDYRDCEGDLNLNWNGLGYKTALEVLIKKFPDPTKQLAFDQKVLLNKEVSKVLYDDMNDNAVTVKCSDKSTYEANHVIFTPSIGVLKEQHEKMFYPALPEAKQEAIKNIGFGAVMKVAMHFRKRFWAGGNFTGFNFVWGEGDKHSVLKEFPGGPVKEGRSWLTEFYSVIPVEHNPNVLIAWLTGDLIPKIEKLSNETVAHGVVFVMNKFLGHKYNISEPDSIIRTTWYTNPHFRGTYSYQTVEARKGEVTAEVELAKPIRDAADRPIIQFAGEASHPYYYSTVHGAIETGHREADRIIKLYN